MFIRVARIVNTFGIRGELKVISETDFPDERFKPGQSLYIIRDNKKEAEVTIESARQQKGTYILSFEEYDNINQVEVFKGAWLAIDQQEQQTLDDDEYYYHQIIGLDVYTTENLHIGKIKDILSLGSNDVWVVKRSQPKLKDALIPYIEDVVKSIDLEKGLVMIELMEGLIDDEN